MPHLILSFTAQIYCTRSHSPTPLQSMSPYTWDNFDPWFRNRSSAGQVFLNISTHHHSDSLSVSAFSQEFMGTMM